MPEENDYEELKAQLEKIRSDYNRAKKIFQGVEEFGERFEKLRALLNDENNGVEKNFGWVNERKNKIEEFYLGSQKNVNEIAANLDKVKSYIENMQAQYALFTEAKGKLDGKNGEIDQILANVKSLKSDIEKTKVNTEGVLAKVQSLFTEVQQKIQGIQVMLDNFAAVRIKIEDKDTGLQAILNAAQDLQKKSQALFQEIQSFRDESQKLLENIRNNEIESTTLKESTHRIFEESRKTTDAKIEEIKKITALITDTGFANAFNERAKKLFWGYIVWGVILLISTSILVVELYQFFKAFGGDNIPEIKVIIFRLSLTSPLLFLIGFSISQYRFDRLLNEKYNFKAVTASVVREHIEFLLSRFDAKDGAWELTREIFEMIYEEPYEKHEYGYRKIKEIEKEISDFKKEKEVDIKKIIDSAKELKGLFSDENLLKRVIEFFSKFF